MCHCSLSLRVERDVLDEFKRSNQLENAYLEVGVTDVDHAASWAPDVIRTSRVDFEIEICANLEGVNSLEIKTKALPDV